MIEKHFRNKFDAKEILNELIKKGYVGCKKKRSTNYWVNAGMSINALESHDYRISRGGRMPLMLL